MKYACLALVSLLAALIWLHRNTCAELVETRTALAVAAASNEINLANIERLQWNLAHTDAILAGWNEDRTTLAGVRKAARQAIMEALRDETFKAWADSPAPDDAWRVLREPVIPGFEN